MSPLPNPFSGSRLSPKDRGLGLWVSKNSTTAPPQRITMSTDATTASRQAIQTFVRSLDRPPPHARRLLTQAPLAKQQSHCPARATAKLVSSRS
jgi:hypothetical protein